MGAELRVDRKPEGGDAVLAYLLSPEQARGRTRIPSGDWTNANRHKEDWR